MYKTITKLTNEQKDTLISGFLTRLGKRLESKRLRLNLSQSELADCLDIDRTTISRYESGTRDMQVSMLPLFSTYCKFPMYELFPRDESQEILDTFATAVSITVERKKRQEELRQKKSDEIEELKQKGQEKILKGQVFDINGMEVYEPVPPKLVSKSLRERYKDAEMQAEYVPYSEAEFCDFVRAKGDILVDAVMYAGQFLKQIEEQPHKETLRGIIADYIVDELVINEVSQKHPDEVSRRAYAYYRMLYYRSMDS